MHVTKNGVNNSVYTILTCIHYNMPSALLFIYYLN